MFPESYANQSVIGAGDRVGLFRRVKNFVQGPLRRAVAQIVSGSERYCFSNCRPERILRFNPRGLIANRKVTCYNMKFKTRTFLYSEVGKDGQRERAI